jgi:hypothetical protein
MKWSGAAQLAATPLTNITLSGTPIAAVANVKNFTFARVYAAGHEVVSPFPLSFPLILRAGAQYFLFFFSRRSSPRRRSRSSSRSSQECRYTPFE